MNNDSGIDMGGRNSNFGWQNMDPNMMNQNQLYNSQQFNSLGRGNMQTVYPQSNNIQQMSNLNMQQMSNLQYNNPQYNMRQMSSQQYSNPQQWGGQLGGMRQVNSFHSVNQVPSRTEVDGRNEKYENLADGESLKGEERNWNNAMALGHAAMGVPDVATMPPTIQQEVRDSEKEELTGEKALSTEGVLARAKDRDGLTKEEMNAMIEIEKMISKDPRKGQDKFSIESTNFKKARYGWVLGEGND